MAPVMCMMVAVVLYALPPAEVPEEKWERKRRFAFRVLAAS